MSRKVAIRLLPETEKKGRLKTEDYLLFVADTQPPIQPLRLPFRRGLRMSRARKVARLEFNRFAKLFSSFFTPFPPPDCGTALRPETLLLIVAETHSDGCERV